MLTPGAHPDPQDRRLERAGRLLAGSFGALGVAVTLALLARPLTMLDLVIAVLVGVSAAAALLYWRAAGDLELRRRGEVEGFARILQGLSRSISPDAIVEAIAEELGVAAGADHVVVVRLRPNSGLLEATLVTNRAGVPSSTTILPLSDLEDPLDRVRTAAVAPVPVGPGQGDGHAGDRYPRGGLEGGGLRGPAWEDYRSVVVNPMRADGDEQTEEDAAAWLTQRPVRDRGRSGNMAVAARHDAVDRTRGTFEPDPAGGGHGAGVRDLSSPVAPVLGASLGRDGRLAVPDAADPVDLVEPPAPGKDVRSTGRAPSQAAIRIAERIAARVRAVFGLKHTIVAPLVPGGVVVGAIVLSRRTADAWPPASGRLLQAAAVEASAALARAYSHRAAEERAATDALTGLPNRRYFDEYMGLFARRRRSGDAVGILMIDIDHFKRLNDRFGHATGDAVLKAVASAIVSAVREDDVPARFGGEEFVVLLRNPGSEVAAEVGERVRQAVRRLDLSDLGVPGVTVSVGVSVASSPDRPMSELIEEADQALYRAKRAGRNRVVAA